MVQLEVCETDRLSEDNECNKSRHKRRKEEYFSGAGGGM